MEALSLIALCADVLVCFVLLLLVEHVTVRRRQLLFFPAFLRGSQAMVAVEQCPNGPACVSHQL